MSKPACWIALLLCLTLLCSAAVRAEQCSEIWTQAIRANSAVPTNLALPAAPNANFPEPLLPVDYYYNGGNFVIDNGVVRTTTGASTRLFVNGNLTINNSVQLNAGGPPQNLIIVVTGSLVVSNNAVINGFVLTGGSVQLNSNVVINGALTAKGAVANFGATVNYRPEAIPSLVGGVVCDNNQALPLARAHYALDFCAAASGSVVDDLRGNYPATAANVGAQPLGQVLEAADFSASGSDYISVPAAALHGLTNFTLSLWFNLDAGSGFRELFSASNGSTDSELELYINGSNELRAAVKGTYYTFTGGSSSALATNNSWTQVTLVRNAGQLCLYQNDVLVRCVSANSNSLNVVRAAIGIWWRANGSLADDFRGDIDEVLLFNQALSGSQVQQLYLLQKAGLSYDGSTRSSKCSSCLTDNFNSNLTADWATHSSSGSFTPTVVNGRLRITEAVGNQSTSATYQRLYPAANNLVVVEFDYWAYGGSGADGLALVLSDASITPQAGSFGGPLGYGFKPGIDGFAGGWLGFGLDEYGNFSAEGGSTNIGRRRQSVVIRGSGSGTSGYRYLRGTCDSGSTNTNVNCLDPAVDGNQSSAHRYRFTIDSRTDGTTLVSVDRNSGGGFVSLIAPFNVQNQTGQAPVPENFLLSLTGSTGGSTNIHELDNLSICALRSLPVGQQIDHFEFDYSGQALTCKPETFTVRACKNASCSELVTDPVSATLSPANSATVNWLGGNVVNFSGGLSTVQLRRTVAGSTTVGVSASVPSTRPLSQTLCRAGSGSLSAQACSVTFADSGLVFSIPDGIANQFSPLLRLSAVRKDNNSEQCVPEFANVSRTISFWSDYITPDANNRPASMAATVNGVEVGREQASASGVTLHFNSAGQATMSVNYPDAGAVQLNARYTGSAADNDAGLLMQGADQFTRRPQALCVRTAGQCAAADDSCPAFRRAGEAFDLSISAHRFEAGSSDVCSNPVTPNFSAAQLVLSHSLVAPADGDSGTLAHTQYTHLASSSGETVLAQSVSEVGVFRFNTAPYLYLGMTDPIPSASSLASGRFIPADFSLSSGAAVAACGSFSYFGQPSFSTAFTLQARNLAGQRTRNYYGAFARLDVTQWQDDSALQGLRFSAPDLPPGAVLGAGSLAPVGDWQRGEAQVLATHQASRPHELIAPQALTVYAWPKDSDGVQSAGALAVNHTPTELRYGRLVLANAAGPHEQPLPLRLHTEYWDGSQFRLNLADSCSVLPAQTPLLVFEPLTPGLSLNGSGGTVLQGQLATGALLLNSGGEQGNWLIQYQTDPWLQYYWRGASRDVQQNPSAEVMFGRFRGNPRLISWRERFQ